MITLIVGSVPWLQQQSLARLEKEWAGAEWYRFFGADVTANQIWEASTTLSLLGDKVIVLVRGAERLRRPEQEKLLAGLERHPEEAHLVLVADKIDKRLKFWQQLLKRSEFIAADPPPPRELAPWFQKEIKRRGLRFSRAAGNVLVEVAGQDFNQAVLLLEKVQLFLGDAVDVNLELIETCRVGGQAAKIFEWSDAVGAGRWEQSFAILQGLWSAQESPIAMLALLVRHFRILLIALENRDLWRNRSEMARQLGVPPFVVERYCQQAAQYSRGELIAIWHELLETDRALKASPIRKEIVLEELVWRLRRKRIKAAV